MVPGLQFCNSKSWCVDLGKHFTRYPLVELQNCTPGTIKEPTRAPTHTNSARFRSTALTTSSIPTGSSDSTKRLFEQSNLASEKVASWIRCYSQEQPHQALRYQSRAIQKKIAASGLISGECYIDLLACAALGLARISACPARYELSHRHNARALQTALSSRQGRNG
jgi:hypothetical protein